MPDGTQAQTQVKTYTTAVQKAVQKAIMPNAVQPNGTGRDAGVIGPLSSCCCRLTCKPRAGEGTDVAVLASAMATGTSADCGMEIGGASEAGFSLRLCMASILSIPR